jgi:hypothetical protein
MTAASVCQQRDQHFGYLNNGSARVNSKLLSGIENATNWNFNFCLRFTRRISWNCADIKKKSFLEPVFFIIFVKNKLFCQQEICAIFNENFIENKITSSTSAIAMRS